jgi:predicted ATPase
MWSAQIGPPTIEAPDSFWQCQIAGITRQRGKLCGTVLGVVAQLGRQRPLEVLTGLAAAVTQGRGSLAMVRGAAGIGKTRVVEELAQTATGWGLDVACSACWEGSAAPAFWPWIHLFRDLGLDDAADRLDAGFGLGGTAEPRSARLALLDGVARDLVVAVRERPAMVVIEDIHWADPGTLLVLRVVADTLGTTPLLLVITLRDQDAAADLAVANDIAVLARQATIVDLLPFYPG